VAESGFKVCMYHNFVKKHSQQTLTFAKCKTDHNLYRKI